MYPMTMNELPDSRQPEKTQVSEVLKDTFNLQHTGEMLKQNSNGTNSIDTKLRRANAMKKMSTVVNQNDRVVIDIINRESIQYILVEAKTGKETLLGEPIDFSLSVKKYFGAKGRMIKELYDFRSWHNRKLQTEMKRIWRTIGELNRTKDEMVKVHPIVTAINTYDDERAA